MNGISSNEQYTSSEYLLHPLESAFNRKPHWRGKLNHFEFGQSWSVSYQKMINIIKALNSRKSTQ
jgi:hypothetical protein